MYDDENLNDKETAGQQRRSVIWEITAAFVVLSVTTAMLYVAVKLSLINPFQTAAFLLLSNAFFLILGLYFRDSTRRR